MAENAIQVATGEVRKALAFNQKTIERLLPKVLDAGRFFNIVMTELRRNPKLLECTTASLMKCVVQSAQLGLYPDSILGLAYLIPYKTEATLIPGYKGLLDLAYRGGLVRRFDAHVIYEADEFDFSYGTEHYLRHKPKLSDRGEASLDADGKIAGPVIGAYAIANVSGEPVFEVMSLEDLEKVKSSSSAVRAKKTESPWFQHTGEMLRKCPIRRLAKFLPMSPELQRAVAFEARQDAGIDPQLVFDDGAIDVTDEALTAADQTRRKAEALKDKHGPKLTPIEDDCGCPDGPADLHEPGCAKIKGAK